MTALVPYPYSRGQCPATHTLCKGGGQWVVGDKDDLVRWSSSSGHLSWRFRCTLCGTRSSAYPRKLAEEWIQAGKPWAPAEAPQRIPDPPCAYANCQSAGSEDHHLAPRNTFGPDAENWPIAPLCPAHHREWHARMDGYRRAASWSGQWFAS